MAMAMAICDSHETTYAICDTLTPSPTVASWWLGVHEGRIDSPLLSEEQWGSLLLRTGYSGLDVCLRDSSDENMWTMSMMTSTNIKEIPVTELFDLAIVYDDPQQLDTAGCLAKLFETSLGTNPSISTLLGIGCPDQIIVIVDRAKGSLLLDINERKLEVLKSIFAHAKGVLWITFGGSGNSKNPGVGAVTGILRTLRSENDGMSYAMCDVDADDFSKPELVQAISKVFIKTFSNSNLSSSARDFEYAVQDGRITIPRLVEDRFAKKAIMTHLSKREPEEQPFWQESSCLCLDMGHLGLLDTFQFVYSEAFSTDMHHDEVEIEVKAIGLNFHDLMVATGQIPDLDGYGLDCAGIVTKLGKATHSLSVSDRVCAIAPSSFANRVRISQTLVGVIPDTMTFEVGASIPSVFSTVYYCIYHAAHLRKDESILIHSAADGIGQACIKMAQLVGANIFATVGSEAKARFLEKTFGLPPSHILNSRTLDFRNQIMSLTEGKGVDVVINSLAGDALRESWRCLAMFGRFIELGKKDTIDNTRLDMAPFERSTSFINVGLDYLGRHRPELVGSILKKVIEMFSHGTLTPLEPITTFPMSAIEPAFRYMASGTHMGKIVVTADRDCVVRTVPKSPPPFKLRSEASYLIVGGLGGIGVEMAKWMVHELGVKSIILISRSGMDASVATETVEALKGSDVVVVTVRKCDVADKEDISAVLRDCAQTLPPIRGVVQGAMVLKDAIFPNMTLDKYYQALNPKIRGSQNLHDFFQHTPDQIDFFVMLSSIGGILGNVSQSNYAAGNTFQDALAHHRASHGLPALTIDVGHVVDAGWVARNQENVVVSRGVLAMAKEIRVKDLTALIEHHIRTGSTGCDNPVSQIAIGLEEYPAYDARFSHVGASLAGFSQNRGPQDQTQPVSAQIAAAGHDSAQMVLVILEAFRQKLGRLLALNVEDVREEDTIAGHGVDSLVAVEIRNWFRKEVKADVTVFDILDGKKSVRVFVERIVKEIVKA